MLNKISKKEVRRHFEMCVKETTGLSSSEESFIGFLVGFRMYERIAIMLDKQVTEEESHRVVSKDLSRAAKQECISEQEPHGIYTCPICKGLSESANSRCDDCVIAECRRANP